MCPGHRVPPQCLEGSAQSLEDLQIFPLHRKLGSGPRWGWACSEPSPSSGSDAGTIQWHRDLIKESEIKGHWIILWSQWWSMGWVHTACNVHLYTVRVQTKLPDEMKKVSIRSDGGYCHVDVWIKWKEHHQALGKICSNWNCRVIKIQWIQ